jgi:hypothetical protein
VIPLNMPLFSDCDDEGDDDAGAGESHGHPPLIE